MAVTGIMMVMMEDIMMAMTVIMMVMMMTLLWLWQ
jgi:hypothetical protein